jgi:hypothetical protein
VLAAGEVRDEPAVPFGFASGAVAGVVNAVEASPAAGVTDDLDAAVCEAHSGSPVNVSVIR